MITFRNRRSIHNLTRIALQSITANWGRAVLAMLALSASVVGIVTVASGSSTIQTTVTQRAVLEGGNPATFVVSGARGTVGMQKASEYQVLLEDFVGHKGTVVRRSNLASTAILTGGMATPISMTFTEPSLTQIHPYHLVEGSWISESEGTAVVRLVINRVASTSLQLDIGDLVYLRTPGVTSNVSAVVRGVIDDAGNTEAAYASLEDGDGFLRMNSTQASTALEVSMSELSKDVLVSRFNALSSFRAESLAWDVQQTDTVSRLEKEIAATQSAFLIVGGLGLLAGAFGVANIGLSALRERADEMSLRRALGAKRWHIPAVLVIESQVIALVAGIVALGVSYFLHPLIAAQFGAPYGIPAPEYPWPIASLGLAIGMLTALVGSIPPALVALKVPIVRVMRA